MLLHWRDPHQTAAKERDQSKNDQRCDDIDESVCADPFFSEKPRLFLSLFDHFLLKILLLQILHSYFLQLVDCVHPFNADHNKDKNHVVEDQTSKESHFAFGSNLLVAKKSDD